MKTTISGLRALPLLCLLATGCATGPAPITDRRAYDDVLGRVAQAGGAALLASGCAYRDEVGNDAILLESSATLARATVQESTRYLTAQGSGLREPTPGSASVVPPCAGFAAPPGETVLIMTNADDPAPRSLSALDLRYPGQPYGAAGAREAIDRVFRLSFDDAFEAQAQEARSAPAPTPQPLPLTAAEKAALREATGRDWLWLVLSINTEMSLAKTMGTGFANESGAAGAYVGNAMRARVTTGTQAALVDLLSGTRVWRGFSPERTPGVRLGVMQEIDGAGDGELARWGNTLFAPILNTGVAPRVAGTDSASTATVPAPAPAPAPAPH